jgi:hypothetical protein
VRSLLALSILGFAAQAFAQNSTATLAVMAVVPHACSSVAAPGDVQLRCSRGTQASVKTYSSGSTTAAQAIVTTTASAPSTASERVSLVTVTYEP